jgi:hypothetical protein
MMSLIFLTDIAMGSPRATCAEASCPTGYYCAVGSSGALGCYKNEKTPQPDIPSCKNAICQKGYYCSVVSGAARCVKEENDENTSGNTTAPKEGCGYNGFRNLRGELICPIGHYCEIDGLHTNGICKPAIRPGCLIHGHLVVECGWSMEKHSCYGTECPQGTYCSANGSDSKPFCYE